MDPQDIPDDTTKQETPADSQGLAGSTQSKARGRPRKQAAASHGFAVPTRPEVEQADKQDPRKFAVVPIRAITDKSITPHQFRTLALIASYANRNGFTWVGQHTLAAAAGITQQAMSLHILALKQAGLIEETAKAYWGGGPTARCSTMRVVFDPSMSTDDVIAKTGSAEQEDGLVANTPRVLVESTSFGSEVVDSDEARQPTKADLQRLLPSLIAEVQARYRSEGLPVPVGDRLAREVADLTSAKQRSGTLLA